MRRPATHYDFEALVFNTLVSAGGLIFVNLIALLLVPVLVHAYGVTQYGLIVLARLFLPAAAFSLFDFGFSETVTQAIVRARVSGDWQGPMREVAGVLIVAAVVGIAVAAGLALGAGYLAELMKPPGDAARAFEFLLYLNAAAFAPLLVGLVVDGLVKGFESFPALRSADAASALLYAGFSLWFVYAGFGFAWVGAAYVGSQVFRLIPLLLVAWRKLETVQWQAGLSFWPTAREWEEVMRRCRLMVGAKWLGTAQNQLAPLLIGGFLGPASAGLYDVIVRIPRVVKTGIGLLNTAVLPAAARLHSQGRSMRPLGEIGLLAMAAIAIPVSTAGMTFSAAILSVWIDVSFVVYAPWHALMFAIVVMNALISFGGMALLVRSDIIGKINLMVLVQLVIQYSLSLALAGQIAERAFILGQGVAMLATLYAILRIQSRAMGMGLSAYAKPAAVAGTAAALSAFCFAAGIPAAVTTPIALAGAVIAWMTVHYAVLWFLILNGAERDTILSTLQSMKHVAANGAE